jgi:DNA (cytosine-5)-methyltransferase 1
MKELTAISLFTGAMGLDLGVEKAGFRVTAAVELNKHACESIRLNRPNLPLFAEDIANVTGKDLLEASNLKKGELDLLIGGPPCQSFSTAGKRRSLTDTKGNCIFEYLRLLEELEPKTFIMENVRGILSSIVQMDGLEVLDENGVKETVESNYPVAEFVAKSMIELGYDVEYKLLNSADYGVPQKRHRVFFIGTKLDSALDFPSPTHDIEAKNGLRKWVTFNDVIDKLKTEGIENHTFIPYNEERRKYMEMIPQGGGNWRDMTPIIAEKAMGKAYTSGGGKVGFFRRIKLNEPAPTLLTSPTHKSTMLGHPLEDRPLSIEEYKEIQQFPQNWKLPSSINSQYMLIGNAVPVGLAYAVAKEVVIHILNDKYRGIAL